MEIVQFPGAPQRGGRPVVRRGGAQFPQRRLRRGVVADLEQGLSAPGAGVRQVLRPAVEGDLVFPQGAARPAAPALDRGQRRVQFRVERRLFGQRGQAPFGLGQVVGEGARVGGGDVGA